MPRHISPEVLAAIADVKRGVPVLAAARAHGVTNSGLYQRLNRLGIAYVGQPRGRKTAPASPLRRERARQALQAAGLPLYRSLLDQVVATMDDDVPAFAAVRLLQETGRLPCA